MNTSSPQLEEKSPVKGDLHAGICGSRGVRFPSATRLSTPSYDSFPLVMVRLERVTVERLEELVTDAWRMRCER